MTGIIDRDRSIVPACDVDLDTFRRIVESTADVDGVGGYKIGPALTGRPGYDAVVEVARAHTNKPLIFDAQKWGTDIPDTAMKILGPVKESGIDAVILFPQAGPVTQYAWTRAAQELELGVIVGGEMTHLGYLEGQAIEGTSARNWRGVFRDELGIMDVPEGFIRNGAPDAIYNIAARMGVTNFVVPGNKPESISRIRGVIESIVDNPSYWAPGFVAQGGVIGSGGAAAGDRFHAIVGRGIYKEGDPGENARELSAML